MALRSARCWPLLSPVPRPQMRSPSTTGCHGSVFQPFGLRVGGIDVVVAVGEPGERGVLRADLAVDDGLARGGEDLHLEAPAPHPRREELDRLADALAGEAHRRDAHGLEERGDERRRRGRGRPSRWTRSPVHRRRHLHLDRVAVVQLVHRHHRARAGGARRRTRRTPCSPPASARCRRRRRCSAARGRGGCRRPAAPGRRCRAPGASAPRWCRACGRGRRERAAAARRGRRCRRARRRGNSGRRAWRGPGRSSDSSVLMWRLSATSRRSAATGRSTSGPLLTTW